MITKAGMADLMGPPDPMVGQNQMVASACGPLWPGGKWPSHDGTHPRLSHFMQESESNGI